MISRLFIILLLGSQQLISQSEFLQSNWVGRLDLSGESYFLRIQEQDGQVLLRMPYLDGNVFYTLNQFQENQGLPRFSIRRQVSDWHFMAEQRQGGTLTGQVQRNGLHGRFYLHQVLDLTPEHWQVYLGNFQTKTGQVFKVWDRFNTLRAHSPLSQEVCRMYAIGKDRFWLATGEVLQFGQRENSLFQSLQWMWGEQELEGQRSELYIEEREVLSMENGDTVGVSLFLPKGSGPFPTVLICRGAGNLDRSINYTEAEIFASYGIATLLYDNYGTGETNGDLRVKDFADKQQLVLYLYNYLLVHEKVNAAQIGLMGGSQGARIATMAAAKDIQPAFLILRAHPMETRKDQQLYAIGAFLRQQNIQEDTIVQALYLWGKYFELAHQQQLDRDYIAAVGQMRKDHPELLLPSAPTDRPPSFAWPDDIYDATMDYLSSIRCPVLSEHGADDDRVPAQKSIHFLREGLAKANHDQLSVILYPQANHSFMMPGFRIVPGLFMNEVNWIKQVLKE